MPRPSSVLKVVVGRLVLLTALGASACTSSSTKACTEIGCRDAFTATLQRADGSFPPGDYQIEVVVSGTSMTCTFEFPLQMGQGGGTFQPSCPAGLEVSVWPATTCTETKTGTATSLTCTPIPGQFVETISVTGTPSQVHLLQWRDGASRLDVTATPTYQETRPNGPECEPVCRQATMTWTLD